MIRSVALVAALALAACGDAADPAPEAATGTEPSIASAPVQPMGPGLYAVGDETTVYARSRLAEDGTYTDLTAEGETVGGGTWSSEGEVICFEPEGDGEDQLERCWRNDQPGEDGSFMSRAMEGEAAYRVTPLDE